VVAKVRVIMAVSTQATQNFDVERFNVTKQSELEGREEYQIEISNRFAAFENVNDSEYINRS
jgi:hypothetical protein